MKFFDYVVKVIAAMLIMAFIGFIVWFGVITETYMMMIGALVIIVCCSVPAHQAYRWEIRYYESLEEEG